MSPSEIVVGGRYTNGEGTVCEIVSERTRQAGTPFAHRCVEYRVISGPGGPNALLQFATAKVFAAWARERVG